MDVPGSGDFGDEAGFDLPEVNRELKGELFELPDGREALLVGDPECSKDYFHRQGDNEFGCKGDCGLVSCGDVLNQFGQQVSENDVVRFALENGYCQIVPGSPEMSGGTSLLDQVEVLKSFGVPAHLEIGGSLEGVADRIADGHGVIIEVNAGELWDDPAYYDGGDANHAITITNVAFDPATGEVEGVFVDDSGAGQFHHFLPADHAALRGWIANGAPSVVTDMGHQ
jgi:hypothetical protein